jgi:hypothetical protein
MKKKDTTLSEQFHHQISKSEKKENDLEHELQ